MSYDDLKKRRMCCYDLLAMQLLILLVLHELFRIATWNLAIAVSQASLFHVCQPAAHAISNYFPPDGCYYWVPNLHYLLCSVLPPESFDLELVSSSSPWLCKYFSA